MHTVWDSVQGLCSYIRGMLSSQAILRGIGVGNTSATTGSAVFHFFMRDFSGMLGGVLFAMFQASQAHMQHAIIFCCASKVACEVSMSDRGGCSGIWA